MRESPKSNRTDLILVNLSRPKSTFKSELCMNPVYNGNVGHSFHYFTPGMEWYRNTLRTHLEVYINILFFDIIIEVGMSYFLLMARGTILSKGGIF